MSPKRLWLCQAHSWDQKFQWLSVLESSIAAALERVWEPEWRVTSFKRRSKGCVTLSRSQSWTQLLKQTNTSGPLFTSGIAEIAHVKIMKRGDTQREAFPRGWWFSRALVYFFRPVSNTWGKRKTNRGLSPSYLNQRWIALSNWY